MSDEPRFFQHPAVLVAGGATALLLVIGVVASRGDGDKKPRDTTPTQSEAKAVPPPAAAPAQPDLRPELPRPESARAAFPAREPSNPPPSVAPPPVAVVAAPPAVAAMADPPAGAANPPSPPPPAPPPPPPPGADPIRVEQARGAREEVAKALREADELAKSGDQAGAAQKRNLAEALKSRAAHLESQTR